MSPLLHSLLERLLAIPTHEWHRTAVIFPSRRAGVAFRKLLAEKIQKTVFAPNILTLPEWLCKETGWHLADTTQLQFDLYEAYLEYDADETLEAFLRWAPKVLSDFSEVDAYLLDANQVFGYLSQEKAIDLWSPQTGELDAYASKYLAFFSRLGGLYHRLREKSTLSKTAWQSLIARHLLQSCEQEQHPKTFKHYFFAGFNALNRAEAGLLKHWIQHASAQVLFEADQHYLREEHEAGLFLRAYLEDELLKRNFHIGTKLFDGDSQISLVEAMGNSAQVQMAGQQVRQWLASGVDAGEIVVVLANEQLLVPMLQALPASLPAVNVSMGYPLTESHAFSLLQAWSLWVEPLADGRSAYVPHLLSLLTHPFLQGRQWQEPTNQILAAGKLWMDVQEATLWTQRLAEALGVKADLHAHRPSDWIKYWQEIFNHLAKQKDKLQESMCLQAIVLLRKLSIQLHRFDALNVWSIFKPFLLQSSRSEQVAFLGEPMQGLQVMGLLETRALAFRYVIVVGMNEGKLPAAQNADGFITYTLRREFGLPGPREKEAVFAYHFYRLLQNADEAVLICNGSTDDFGQGEPSRYLEQIRLEWTGTSKGKLVRSNVVLPAAEIGLSQDILIQKTPEIQKQILGLLQQKLSPSALQLYISCPLKFYLGRILRLKPADDLLEELQANEIGELLHEVLETLYSDFVGQVLAPQQLASFRAHSEQILQEKLRTKFPHKDFKTGINLLIAEVCKSYLDKFLELETLWCTESELIIEQQELAMSGEIDTVAGPVTLFGKADRIDRMDGSLRIIDYKTGKFDKQEMKLTAAEELLTPDKLKAFQLLAYTWLYNRQEAPLQLPEVGILSFRMMREGPKMLEIQGSDMANALQWFEKTVQHIVAELVNIDIPISQTTDHDICTRCDFKGICNR